MSYHFTWRRAAGAISTDYIDKEGNLAKFMKNVLVLLLTVGSVTALQGSDIRKALVIGNDNYPGNKLRNARNDATAIAKTFTSLGYATTLELDLDHKHMAAAVDAFSGHLKPGDTAILYYAGHGLQVNGENYLVPTDFKVREPADVAIQGYSLSLVLDKFAGHGATTQLIILDACRDNPFLATRSIRGGWSGMSTSAGTFLAFGTSPGSTASDDPAESHGLFTKELLKYIGSSPLDVEQMFQEVREEVIRASNGQQVPWTSSSLVGSFHFISQLDEGSKSFLLASSVDKTGTRIAGESSFARGYAEVAAEPLSVGNHPVENTSRSALLSSGSGPSPLLLQQTIQFANSGDYSRSLRGLKAILELDPQSGLALRILGLVLGLRGESSRSVEAFDRAIAVDPQDASAYYYRCLALAPNNPTLAISDCKAAIRINPGLTEAHLGLAEALLTLGEPDRASSEATIVTSRSAKDPLGFAMLGKIRGREGNAIEAQQNYQEAINLSSAQ